MIALLDTNAILRYLTNDIPQQSAAIEKRLEACEKGDLTLEVTQLIIAETLFHLIRWYGLSREDAAEKLITFLSPEWINTTEKSTVVSALRAFQETSIDFADLLLWSQANHEHKKILSFDRDFDRLSPNLRLDP